VSTLFFQNFLKLKKPCKNFYDTPPLLPFQQHTNKQQAHREIISPCACFALICLCGNIGLPPPRLIVFLRLGILFPAENEPGLLSQHDKTFLFALWEQRERLQDRARR
jgi:hypothetical protein